MRDLDERCATRFVLNAKDANRSVAVRSLD